MKGAFKGDSNKDLLELYDYTNEANNPTPPTSETRNHESTRVCSFKKTAEVVVLSAVIGAAWISLSLPIVFFHIRSDGSLFNTTDTCSTSFNSSTIGSGSGSDNITCSESFYLNASTDSCTPHCGQWEEYPHAKQITSDAIIGTAACIGIAVTVFIIVMACVRDRNMLKFPSVMVIYQNVTISGFSVLVLVGFMDRNLFCSSNDLLQTFQHSTPFCKLTGIGIIYTTMPLAVWAVAHVNTTLWAVHFPFHYNQFKKTMKMTAVHISLILVGVFLPLIPAIITLTSGGFSVFDTRYPPIACRARNRHVTVYALIIPISILLAVGVTSLVFILRSLLKHFGPRKLKGAQIRIVFIFIYYALLGLVAISAFTLSSMKLPKFSTEVCDYFECEHTGGLQCSRKGFEQYTNATVVTIAYSLVVLYPVVTLVFTIPSKDLMKLKILFSCCCNQNSKS